MTFSVVNITAFIFFFFKQKTAYEMRISDWSSDVCSSDLFEPATEIVGGDEVGEVRAQLLVALVMEAFDGGLLDGPVHPLDLTVIRHEGGGALRLGCSSDRRYGETIRVLGRWKHVSRSEEHTSELQSLMRISYAVFCLKKKNENPETLRR